MSIVMVEREFQQPVDFASIQEIEDRGAWCLEMHQVRFLRTWFSRDRRRMVCLYEAPDADSVRIAQRKAGMPVTRVWAAHRVAPPPEADGAIPPGAEDRPFEHIVVERAFDAPWSPHAIAEALARCQPCMQRHDALYRGGYLSADGLRMICVFEAPDAESVRIANRAAGVPHQRAWSATLHEPSGR